ncbi:MAG: nuclear transport factor 2 family protein, partial [Solirubrobacterales bacterium]
WPMSKENVELWDKILRAFRRASANSDWEAWISRFDETLDPDVEWDASDVPIPDLVGTYRGIEAVAGWWRKWLDAWETVEFDYELVDAGDRVVLFVDQRCADARLGWR